MNKKMLFILLVLTIVVFAACAPSVNVEACVTGKQFGFWGGLWHGIIAPIDFVAMLFNDKYTVFAQNNNGAWYAFGFLLGSGGWGFLGAKGAKKRCSDRD